MNERFTAGLPWLRGGGATVGGTCGFAPGSFDYKFIFAAPPSSSGLILFRWQTRVGLENTSLRIAPEWRKNEKQTITRFDEFIFVRPDNGNLPGADKAQWNIEPIKRASNGGDHISRRVRRLRGEWYDSPGSNENITFFFLSTELFFQHNSNRTVPVLIENIFVHFYLLVVFGSSRDDWSTIDHFRTDDDNINIVHRWNVIE